MDLQSMYEDLQTKIKENVDKIEAKQKEISSIKEEISTLDADILRLQGAVEMLVILSKGLEEQKEDTIINEQEEITEIATNARPTCIYCRSYLLYCYIFIVINL